MDHEPITKDEEAAEMGALIARLEAENKRLTANQPAIHGAMITAMRNALAVGKDGRNSTQGYSFRGIDGTLNVVGPALRKAGVFVTSEILGEHYADAETTKGKNTREVRIRVRFTFWAEDGSSVSTEVAAESLDTSDKGLPKAFSVALRIALLQTFALPTDDPTPDDDDHYHERSQVFRSRITADERAAGLLALGGTGTAGLQALLIFAKDVLNPKGAWNEPISEENATHWKIAFAQRAAGYIAVLANLDEARAAYKMLKETGFIDSPDVDGKAFGHLVNNRARDLTALQAKAFDHLMEIVTKAETIDELEAARLHIDVDLVSGPISQEQATQLIEIVAERAARLAQATAANLPTWTDAAPEFLPPVGTAWDLLVAYLAGKNLKAEDLRRALDGGYGDAQEGVAAAEFGMDGIQRVVDALKASLHRDRSITGADYQAVAVGIRNAAQSVGLMPLEGVL